MIVTLAGRRIDPTNADRERFPERNIPKVQKLLGQWLLKNRVSHLVSSAACGADLLAHEVANDLGISRSIVLPFDKVHFRVTSVIDRPGRWDAMYNTLLKNCSLTVLNLDHDDKQAYRKANDEILRIGQALSREFGERKFALCVWDGTQKNERDITSKFKHEARQEGFEIGEILTI